MQSEMLLLVERLVMAVESISHDARKLPIVLSNINRNVSYLVTEKRRKRKPYMVSSQIIRKYLGRDSPVSAPTTCADAQPACVEVAHSECRGNTVPTGAGEQEKRRPLPMVLVLNPLNGAGLLNDSHAAVLDSNSVNESVYSAVMSESTEGKEVGTVKVEPQSDLKETSMNKVDVELHENIVKEKELNKERGSQHFLENSPKDELPAVSKKYSHADTRMLVEKSTRALTMSERIKDAARSNEKGEHFDSNEGLRGATEGTEMEEFSVNYQDSECVLHCSAEISDECLYVGELTRKENQGSGLEGTVLEDRPDEGNDRGNGDEAKEVEARNEKQTRGQLSQNTASCQRKTAKQGKKSFRCRKCSKYFSSLYKLKSHSKVHAGEDLFKCTICSKTFSDISNLSNHLKIHSGQQSFECSYCSKVFPRKSSKNQHIKSQHKEKLFECGECTKKFRTSNDLKRHMCTHTGKKIISCTDCGKNFAEPSHALQHRLSVHKKDPL